MKPLMNLEIAEFCSQIHMMLGAGISGLEALNLLLEDAENSEEKALLEVMIETMEQTGYFYEAAASTKAFPDYAFHMMKLGEETGTLDKIMGALASHYTREENISGMIRSALIYPAIMLSMMVLVIVILLTKVMPVFNQVFAQLGQEMTGFSAGLLQVGETLSTYGIGFVIGILILAIFIFTQRKKLPFQRKIQEQLATCRFADGMSIALKSGLTPENGLELAEKLVEQDDLRKKLQICKDKLAEGVELYEALKETGVFTGAYARMAYIAGKSGTLDEAMEQIAYEYEYSANAKINGLVAMLEPTLVILLSLIVGVILFSVMLPLLGIMSSL